MATLHVLPVRVAYISSLDPANVRNWSGLVHFIYQAVARQEGVEMVPLAPLREWSLPVLRARQAWERYVHGKRHVRDQDPATLAAFGWQATRRVAQTRPDVILAPGFHHVARLQTDVPVVTYTDATFADVVGIYGEYSSLSAASTRHGDALSRAAARTFAVQCFAAPHAARSAVEVYGADPARVRVIPFGANLDAPPTADETEQALQARLDVRPIRFLFLGVDWERKGGPLAVEVVAGLRAAGVDAVLDVVGCTPVVGGALPAWVRPLGFVSKATPDGQARLRSLLAASHFLLLPTMAESFGVVFCEAGAFAVPSLTRRVGGVPVWDGENGYAFPADAGPEPYVEAVLGLLREPGAYAALARSARAVYDDRLNWDTAGATLVETLREAIRLGPPARDA